MNPHVVTVIIPRFAGDQLSVLHVDRIPSTAIAGC